MMVKHLSQSGNSKAILIDRALLQAAGLNDDALFAITVNPNGGLIIQSVESTYEDIKRTAFRKIIKKNHKLLERLSDK
jgi:antitoxin component of MazEF toxin-antitoxin module